MHETKLTPEQINEMCRKYEAGINTQKLGRMYKKANRNIREILISNGVNLRKPGTVGKKFAPEQIKEISSLYENGISMTKLSEIFRTSQAKIRSILIGNNVSIRKCGATSSKAFFNGVPITDSRERADIIKSYMNGAPMSLIAQLHNTYPERVKEVLEQENAFKMRKEYDAAVKLRKEEFEMHIAKSREEGISYGKYMTRIAQERQTDDNRHGKDAADQTGTYRCPRFCDREN